MATPGTKSAAPAWLPRSRSASRLPRSRAEWGAAGVSALVLGLLAARTAAAGSSRGLVVLLAALVPFLLMLVGDVRRTLIVVVVFDTAFQWDKNFGWNANAAGLGAIGGLNVSVTTLALAGLYALWFTELAAGSTRVARGTFRAALPLVVYVGFTAVSIIAAGNKTLSFYELAMLTQTLLLFIYVAGSIRTRDEIRFVVSVLVTCLLVESALTLVLPYIGSHKVIGITTYAQTDTIGGSSESRFGGTLGSPNTAAAFFSLLVAPAVAIVAAQVSSRTKKIAVAAVPLATLALILTLSRGGWVALVVSFLFLTLAGTKRGWISPRVPIAFAIGLTVVALPFSGTLATRITGSDQGSASSRIPLIHLAVNVIRDHPFLGVGANNLGLVFPTYAGPQYDQDWIYTVHNKYLLVWAEAGMGALIAFLWFLLSTLRRGWRLWRGSDPLVAPLALGLTAGVIGQMVHMSVDIFQSRPQVQLLWFVAALLVAMQNVEETSPANSGRVAESTPLQARPPVGSTA